MKEELQAMPKNRIVFELNNWTLEKVNPNIPGSFLVLRHHCTPPNNKPPSVPKVFVYPYTADFCWRCNDTIPDAVIALFRLHEWDSM